MRKDIVSAFISDALFTEQGYTELRVRQKTVSRRWQTAIADSVRLLVHLWPKESAANISTNTNHRLTAAITDLAANQSQTCAHKQA